MSKRILISVLLIVSLLVVLVGCSSSKDPVDETKYNLEVKIVGDGVLEPEIGSHKFAPDTIVEVYIKGGEFIKWDEGFDVPVAADEEDEFDYIIKMDGNKVIQGIFFGAETQTLLDFEEDIEDFEINTDITDEGVDITFSQDTTEIAPDCGNASVKVEYTYTGDGGQMGVGYFDSVYSLPHAIYFIRVKVSSDSDFNYMRPYIQTTEEGYPYYPLENVTYLSADDNWETVVIDMTGVSDDAQIFKIGFQLGLVEGSGTFWVDDITYILLPEE